METADIDKVTLNQVKESLKKGGISEEDIKGNAKFIEAEVDRTTKAKTQA